MVSLRHGADSLTSRRNNQRRIQPKGKSGFRSLKRGLLGSQMRQAKVAGAMREGRP